MAGVVSPGARGGLTFSFASVSLRRTSPGSRSLSFSGAYSNSVLSLTDWLVLHAFFRTRIHHPHGCACTWLCWCWPEDAHKCVPWELPQCKDQHEEEPDPTVHPCAEVKHSAADVQVSLDPLPLILSWFCYYLVLFSDCLVFETQQQAAVHLVQSNSNCATFGRGPYWLQRLPTAVQWFESLHNSALL